MSVFGVVLVRMRKNTDQKNSRNTYTFLAVNLLVLLKSLKPISIWEQVMLCSLFLKNFKRKELPQKICDVSFGMFIKLKQQTVSHREVFYENGVHKFFCKIHGKTHVSESLFKTKLETYSLQPRKFLYYSV